MRQRWEYEELRASLVNDEGPAGEFKSSHYEYITIDNLNHMGDFGWEVVSCTSNAEGILFALLKRVGTD